MGNQRIKIYTYSMNMAWYKKQLIIFYEHRKITTRDI